MTPYEFSQMVEGHHWREERAWEKVATIITYLRWTTKPTSVKQVLDEIRGVASEQDFEQVAGMTDPGAAFDATVAKQAERKAKGLPRTST